MTALVPERGTIARTANQSRFCSGDTVGDSRPGVIAQARSTRVAGHVVVEHHVAAGGDHAQQPAAQHLDGGRSSLPSRRTSTASLRRIGSPKTSRPWERRVCAGLDDVGDDVGHPEGDGGLDGAVEAHDRGGDAVVGQVLLDQAGVARGDPGRRRRTRGRGARAGGVPEGGGAEAEAISSTARPSRSRAAGRGR